MCSSSLPTGPIVLPALDRNQPWLKNPAWLGWDLNPRPSNLQSNAQTTTLRQLVLLPFTILYPPPPPVMKHFAVQGNIVFMKFVIKTESPTSLLLSFDSLQRVLFCCFCISSCWCNYLCLTVQYLFLSIWLYCCLYMTRLFFLCFSLYFFWGDGGGWGWGGIHMTAQCLLLCLYVVWRLMIFFSFFSFFLLDWDQAM